MSHYKLYSRLSDCETVLEIWGGSTKHPDVIYHFSKFHLSEWYEPEDQIAPWLYECASRLNIPYHSYELALFASEMYANSRGMNFELNDDRFIRGY